MTGNTSLSGKRDLPRKLQASLAAIVGLLVFLGGLILTGIQTLYTVRYLQAIAAKSDVTKVAALIPAWSRVFMVDLAVVAQALVCFTGARIMIGAWQLLRNPAGAIASDTFPFPRRYRTYYVQYGLWGTVVGFVIGFTNMNTHSDQAPIVLLAALSASLWSTLTAITLAYILCPLIEIVFQRHLVPMSTANEDPLEALQRGASNAALALTGLSETSSLADFSLGLKSLADEFITIRTNVAKASDVLHSANERLASLENELTAAKIEIGKVRESSVRLREEFTAQRQEAAGLRTEVDKRIIEGLAASQAQVAEVQRSFTSDRKRWHKTTLRVVQTGGAVIERLRRSLEE